MPSLMLIRGRFFLWIIAYQNLQTVLRQTFCEFPNKRTYQLFFKKVRRKRGLHCKDTIPKIWNKYSQKWNCAASVLIPTFMFLWGFHDRSAYSAAGKYVNRYWEYINFSQIHVWGNWDWGCAVSFLGVYQSDFLCSVKGAKSLARGNPSYLSALFRQHDN